MFTGLQRIPEAQVRETVRKVLEGPEFPQPPGPIASAFDDFVKWLLSLLPDFARPTSWDADPSAVKVIWFVILLATVIFLGLLIVRYLKTLRQQRPLPIASEQNGIVSRVRDLREQAQRAEQEGNYTLALRLYFFALVVGLGQRGELEYNDAWTNSELLERGETRADVVSQLRPLVGQLNAHSFGELPTQHSEVRAFAELCEKLLGGVAR